MKGDFSKWKYDRKKNYAGVLHQQGKVLLDSDWNVQSQILLEWQDLAGRDIVGPGVAAVAVNQINGFKVQKANVSNTPTAKRVFLDITPGRVWADGITAHFSGTDPVSRVATYFEPPVQEPPGDESTIGSEIRDAVVLEVWREAVNGFQLPDDLIEPALGGVDTTERIQTAFAFRLYRLAEGDDCRDVAEKVRDDWSKKGNLAVSLKETETKDGDCPVTEGGGYTGFEHNLYRIEIAKVDGPDPKFKWSRFNGGLVGRAVFDGTQNKATIVANKQAFAGLVNPADREKLLYLEALEYDTDLGYWTVTYGAEASLGENDEITFPHARKYGKIPAKDEQNPTFFRLWDGIAKIADYEEHAHKELCYGIRLDFEDPDKVKYIPGDYWTFSVRAADVKNNPILIGEQKDDGTYIGKWPEGIHYHRVPLAILNWDDRKRISWEGKQIDDCRSVFRPLTNQKGCCSFTVGDGRSSHGDFDSIEEALSHLPESGGEICLLPGEHETFAVIDQRHDIIIRGCGKRTNVMPRVENPQGVKAIFCVTDSEGITLENMTMTAPNEVAVFMARSESGNLSDIKIINNCIFARIHAIQVERGQNVNICNNIIRMIDKEGSGTAVYLIALDGVVAHNDIGIIREDTAKIPPRKKDPKGDPHDLFDPCEKSPLTGKNRPYSLALINANWGRLPLLRPKTVYNALGGIQIGGSSERVKIIDNLINGGFWNGITLGHIPPSKKSKIEEFEGFVYDLEIEGNDIRNMGLNGIGVEDFTAAKVPLMVFAQDITICRNHIENCLLQIPEKNATNMGLGGIALAGCENAVIRENCIENNGTSHLEPISGIFILLGEKIDISDNRILNNGPMTSGVKNKTLLGNRGGIVILNSFTRMQSQIQTSEEIFSPDGIPAVKIHDNIVTQPLGQALLIFALGPVSIVGNHLTSQGVDVRSRKTPTIAGSILVANLGVSKDLLARVLLNRLKTMLQTNYVFSVKTPAALNRIGRVQSGIVAKRRPLTRLPYLPAGEVLFTGNQTTLDLRLQENEECLSSQLIFSLDDIAYVGNQSECASLLDTVISDILVVGATARINDNRFQEGFSNALFSSMSYGMLMSTAVANQASHCIEVTSIAKPAVKADNTILWEFGYCKESNRWFGGVLGVNMAKIMAVQVGLAVKKDA